MGFALLYPYYALTCAYADGEIAAIAVTQKLTLVTRNTQDFQNVQNLALQN